MGQETCTFQLLSKSACTGYAESGPSRAMQLQKELNFYGKFAEFRTRDSILLRGLFSFNGFGVRSASTQTASQCNREALLAR
jgi:hypothetical protein